MKWNFATLFAALTALVLFETGCIKNTSDQQNNTDSEQTEWKVIGPGGGGGVLKPTISPFDENFVMTHCDMTAAYVSLDGGENWNMKNLWNVPEDFEFDPGDPNTVYAATKGFRYGEDRGSGLSTLLRSVDKGKSWEIVYPDVSKAKKELEWLQNYDYLPSEIIDGAIDGTIEKVAVDPSNNKYIYLGLAPLGAYIGRVNEKEDSAMLVKSADYGKTWKLVTKLPGNSVKAIFPASETGLGGKVVVFTENACVHVNEESGEAKQKELPVKQLIAAEGGKGNNRNLIYIQSAFVEKNDKIGGGMYMSADQGESWSQINNGILNKVAEGQFPAFRKGLGVCETRPETAYISFTSPENNSEGELEYIYSIYKTTNAGEEWKPVYRASSQGGYLSDNFEGSWMEESFDPGWGGAPIDLGVAPNNPDVCFAGDNGRGYKTLDGGKTWEQTYSHNQPDGSYANGGLNVTTCYGVHFDPFDEEHFFICYTDMGLFHTYNGGESWFHSLTNVPRRWQNTCYDLKFDPDVKDKVWAVWGNAHDLPRDKMFGRYGFDRYSGGVTVSLDGGKSWEKSNQGMPENSVCTNILVDPTTPADSRTLFVAVFDKGVYKSADGGVNWVKTNNGFGDNLFAWQVRRNSDGRLFALFSRGKRNDQTVDGAVYYSDDNAESWTEISLPEGVNGPHDLLIDPENARQMYLSCWPRKTEDGDRNGGVYKTTDGGETWKQVFDERIRVNSAALEPENSGIVYINTFQNAAYRSEDAGKNWERIKGYRFKWGQRPVPDPNNPGMLFLTTFGGSVFYGPAEGVENEMKVIENMPENWW
jgi:photosystem II stability/assembly factor-like uncharacterized protein